jgi:predicted ferric reductase
MIPGLKALSPGMRLALTLGLSSLLILILALACWVPFGYESSSILYQFGLDRTLLRSGKMAGLAAGVLLLTQIVTASRLHWLDRILGLNRLFSIHRVCAALALLLAAGHPFLVLGPNGLFSLQPSREFWPEWLGVLLLVCLGFTVALGMWRERIKLPFQAWWLGHRLITPALIVLVGLHALNVSETFASGPPRVWLILALALFGLAWARLKLRRLPGSRASFTVRAVEPVSRDELRVELSPDQGSIPSFLPGQFAFASFESPALSREEHPFTIASSPLDNQCLEMIIKKCGDWTTRAGGLKPGDRARLDGPFGLFSICAHPGADSLVFIAGGVGITPMLSMLRAMTGSRDLRPVSLLWSVRTRADLFLEQELQAMARKLDQVRIETIVTRGPPLEGQPQRLDRPGLVQLLPSWTGGTHFFICGPKAMMDAVQGHLLDMGVERKKIHTERFRL